MIVVIIIIAAFVRKAKSLGLNTFTWGAIAFASYFIPQLIIGGIYGIYIELNARSFDQSAEMTATILGIVGAAIICYWVYQKMPDWATAKQADDHIELLDDDEIFDIK